MKILHIHLLGDFSLVYGSSPVTSFNSTRMQSLLAYLVLHRDTSHPRRSLAYLFWPDSSETQSRTNLRKLLYELRHTFPDIEQFLDTEGQEVEWLAGEEAFTLDVDDFKSTVNQANDTEELKAAINLYKGELLPNCYDDWILLERQHLHQLFIEALEKLITHLEEQRQYHTAITYAHRLLQYAPLQEETYRRLMRLYALNGDRAGVLRTYHQCATTLQRELEVEPSQLTLETYNRLLNMDKPLSKLPSPAPNLVGRSSEWAQLQAAWRAALAGEPQWAILTGEQGVGKTRLAEELLQWAARQGIATASAQCYPTDNNLPYAPVSNLLRARPLPALNKLWLTEIARLLPEILVDHPNLSPPGPLTEPWQRHRFFEALARAMLETQPLLLMVDDLQWCDHDSLEWFHYLLHFDRNARLLLLTTLNSHQLSDEHPFTSLLPTLRRRGQLTQIVLQPLSEPETAALAASASANDLDPERAARLFQDTQGNPFLTLELLRDGRNNSALPEENLQPQTLQSAIQARLAHLSPIAQELTSLAATFGRPFKFDALAHASATGEQELVHGLDELWQRQIVREHATDAFGLSHTKLGEVVYAGLDLEQRKLLHRKVAEALEATGEGDQNIISGEIAAHFEQAGLVRRAIPYYIRAGDAARQVYANKAAINYYQRALALMTEDEYVPVMLKLGEVWQLTGNWTQAEALYRQALRLAERDQNPHDQAQCEAAIGRVLQLKGAYTEAMRWLNQARADFEKLEDQQGVCDVLQELGTIFYWQLDYGSALRHHQQQLQIATQLGDQVEIGEANGSMGLVYWQRGQYDQALMHFEQQLQIANELGDLSRVSSAFGRIGLVHWAQSNYARAQTFFEQELQLAEEIGDRLGIAFALGNIGNLYRDQGDLSRALEYYAQQMQIAISLGDRRLMSHAIRNMGSIYNEQGDYSRALAWYTHSLQIATEIGSHRTIGRSLGNIAIVYTALGKYEQAERLFSQTLALLPESSQPFHLCKYLYYNAALYTQQERFAEAQERNTRALNLAREIGRKAIQFKATLLSIRLRAILVQVDLPAAMSDLEALLQDWPAENEQAAIHYEIWRLAQGQDQVAETHRQTAAKLYQTLYSQSPRAEYRQRYQELTGERLPAAPLPDLPDFITQSQADLDNLLLQVDQMLTHPVPA